MMAVLQPRILPPKPLLKNEDENEDNLLAEDNTNIYDRMRYYSIVSKTNRSSKTSNADLRKRTFVEGNNKKRKYSATKNDLNNVNEMDLFNNSYQSKKEDSLVEIPEDLKTA